MRTIHTTDMAHIRAQVQAAGLILAAPSDRCIIVGRRLPDGTECDTIPALELVALDDDNQPVMHTVAERSPGEWVPFDGVSFRQ